MEAARKAIEIHCYFMRIEVDTEIMATHHFVHNGIKFKMYLN